MKSPLPTLGLSLLAVQFLALHATPVRAGEVVLNATATTASPVDSTPYDSEGDRIINLNDEALGVGNFANNDEPINGISVFVFKLPILPANAKLTGAKLSAYLEGKLLAPAFNADLYGLRRNKSSGEVLKSDFAAGTSTGALLKKGYLTPNTDVQIHLDPVDVLGFVTQGGYKAGDFLFFQVIPDQPSEKVGETVDARYYFQGPKAANAPRLILTTTP